MYIHSLSSLSLHPHFTLDLMMWSFKKPVEQNSRIYVLYYLDRAGPRLRRSRAPLIREVMYGMVMVWLFWVVCSPEGQVCCTTVMLRMGHSQLASPTQAPLSIAIDRNTCKNPIQSPLMDIRLSWMSRIVIRLLEVFIKTLSTWEWSE